jgi:hypothetical protein
MESKDDSNEEKRDAKREEVVVTTPTGKSSSSGRDDDKAFLEGEARRPMKVATHFLGGGGVSGKSKSKSRSGIQFPPSSPTDRMLSPCSRQLRRKKSSLKDDGDDKGLDLDAWAPPPGLRLVLGSSSSERAKVLRELGWSFIAMSPDIDERAIQVYITATRVL